MVPAVVPTICVSVCEGREGGRVVCSGGAVKGVISSLGLLCNAGVRYPNFRIRAFLGTFYNTLHATDHHREVLLKEKVALAPMEPKRPHAITTSKFKV